MRRNRSATSRISSRAPTNNPIRMAATSSGGVTPRPVQSHTARGAMSLAYHGIGAGPLTRPLQRRMSESGQELHSWGRMPLTLTLSQKERGICHTPSQRRFRFGIDGGSRLTYIRVGKSYWAWQRANVRNRGRCPDCRMGRANAFSPSFPLSQESSNPNQQVPSMNQLLWRLWTLAFAGETGVAIGMRFALAGRQIDVSLHR